MAIAWSREANATPTFPGIVQTHYGLAAVAVDPPQGCKLCHVDDIGGTPTTLRPFGRLLYTQFGVLPYNDQSLESALTALDTQEPALAADIRSGSDPNTGPMGAATTTDGGGGDLGAIANADPIPGYGCAIGRAKRALIGPSARELASLIWLVGVLATARMGRRRRPLRRHESPRA